RSWPGSPSSPSDSLAAPSPAWDAVAGSEPAVLTGCAWNGTSLPESVRSPTSLLPAPQNTATVLRPWWTCRRRGQFLVPHRPRSDRVRPYLGADVEFFGERTTGATSPSVHPGAACPPGGNDQDLVCWRTRS